jgi:hypothetical protein
MQGDSREVVLPLQPDVTEQGRKMALRIGVAFIILMAVNVGFGIEWIGADTSTAATRDPRLYAAPEKQPI